MPMAAFLTGLRVARLVSYSAVKCPQMVLGISYDWMRDMISSSIGFTDEGKNFFNSPFSLIKYLQKFQDGSLSFQPFRSLSESQRYSGCLSTPLTDTLSNIWKVTP